MADSSITKRALANSLKELMEELPFVKISIGDICNKCKMNRKSFYYHFKDKYDLVNWIFDTEFSSVLDKNDNPNGWDLLQELCEYLYSNRVFYRHALKIDGQNSFRSHFHQTLSNIIEIELNRIYIDKKIEEFYVHFLTDGFICAIERWILDKDCISPDVFMQQTQEFMTLIAIRVYNKVNVSEKHST